MGVMMNLGLGRPPRAARLFPLVVLILLLLAATGQEAGASEEAGDEADRPLIEMSLSLSGGGQAEGESRPVALEVFSGGSNHDALWNFALKYNVGSDSLLRLKQQLDARAREIDSRADAAGDGRGGDGAALMKHPNGDKFDLDADQLHKKALNDLARGRYQKAARHLFHAVPKHDGGLPDGGLLDYLAPALSRSSPPAIRWRNFGHSSAPRRAHRLAEAARATPQPTLTCFSPCSPNPPRMGPSPLARPVLCQAWPVF